MNLSRGLVGFSVRRPWAVALVMVASTLLVGALAALPSVWPAAFPYLRGLKVDTDPENMLPRDEAVRIFHDRMKEELALHDMVVVGVVNDRHAEGVFNPGSLRKIHALAEFAAGLEWPDPDDPGEKVGVIARDIIAPSTVDNIEQGGPGEVRFEWLMARPPATEQEALAVRAKALRIPFLKGTVVSEDGRALCMYLPLTSKNQSYRVYTELRRELAGPEYSGDERWFITGLPVAEDTFGVEMFRQMAISAPIAMLVIFLLMLWFFRKLLLIAAPMIVAMVSVVWTMGLLVITGNTVHIMSSMIPIFIMPIAVLDSIHVLSEFFDRYQETRDRQRTIEQVMDTLFSSMLYTTLTTMAGFASLALTPIPPVQVFGIFVAIGVGVAWIFTVTFVPASVMFIGRKRLEHFGASRAASHAVAEGGAGAAACKVSPVRRMLSAFGRFTVRRPIPIVIGAAAVSLVAGYGISRIRVNDNPIKWFAPGHPIREADRVLNEHFGGTYMAFLALEAGEGSGGEPEAFKQPEVLRYLERVQEHLAGIADAGGRALVGKSNSLTDIVKTVHREMFEGRAEAFRVPDKAAGVAQCLIQYESSHRPQDLWHFVEKPDEGAGRPGYRMTSVWVQLRSGDNRDMAEVVASVDAFIAASPPPAPYRLRHRWFGLTYINVIWQEKMVVGMLESFAGSFLVVLFMMIVLFRSALWGLLAMLPLTVTIAVIYGAMGLAGKDYDMPVAVLSALSLGLAVDYAIHFLGRARQLEAEHGSWRKAAPAMFGDPARAIVRNVIAVGVGFLPLLAAPLVPYRTVGLFISAILVLAGVATLLIMPALITLLERRLFPGGQTPAGRLACRCGTCFFAALTAVAAVAINIYQFFRVGKSALTAASAAAVVVLAGICWLSSRRRSCAAEPKGETE